jgi:hypothetical protein
MHFGYAIKQQSTPPHFVLLKSIMIIYFSTMGDLLEISSHIVIDAARSLVSSTALSARKAAS